MKPPPRIWWDGYDFLLLHPSDGRDAYGLLTPTMPGLYRAEREDDIASRDGDEMAVELAPRTRTLRLTAVAEAARALHAKGRSLFDDEERAALGAALKALDGGDRG